MNGHYTKITGTLHYTSAPKSKLIEEIPVWFFNAKGFNVLLPGIEE